MSKNAIGAFVLLMIVWLILVENLSWFSVILGGIVSFACLLFTWKFIPLEKVRDVRFLRLIPYALYLIVGIYVQGFVVIKRILTGARLDIVEVKTELKSDFLKALLVNSITLIPGSISLNLEENTITVLNLGHPKDENVHQSVDDNRVWLEKKLMKAQKPTEVSE
ncbi:MAG: Na+/H+ antiporter subunit E [Oscillospiraceae bacterium]|nr:Na+/H+ antiporter subunit E [Oscillospiraceae bacterium]